MRFVYSDGVEVPLGAAGDNDFTFAADKSVTDTGASDAVFEAGVGIGRQTVIANGTVVGYYESDETMGDYIAGKVGAGGTWGYVGAQDAGIVDNVTQGGEDYSFVYHNTADDVWSVGYITNQYTSVIYTFIGSADLFNSPADPDVYKEDEAANAEFSTDPNGDATGQLITSRLEGDAAGYSIPKVSHELTVEQDTKPSLGQTPSGIDFAGPDGRVNESFPGKIDVTILL